MIMAEVKPEPEPEPPWAIDKAVKFWQHSQYPDLSSDFLLSRLEQAKERSFTPVFEIRDPRTGTDMLSKRSFRWS